MSNLFSEEAPTTGNQENATLSAGDTSNQEDFVAKVVAEKGEHWSNPSTLAKGYLHAQARIAELEKLEAEQSKRDYAKELLEQLQLQNQTPKSQGNVPVENTSANTSEAQKEAGQTTSTPENLQSLIEKTLSEREQKNTAKQNITLVEQKLNELFGTEASKVVKNKASELGMSLAKLEALASEAPSAFMALVGGPNPKETNSLPKGSVNTNALATTNTSLSDRNWNYYNKMRKESPKVYRSEQIQKQMMDDRVRLGDKFS